MLGNVFLCQQDALAAPCGARSPVAGIRNGMVLLWKRLAADTADRIRALIQHLLLLLLPSGASSPSHRHIGRAIDPEKQGYVARGRYGSTDTASEACVGDEDDGARELMKVAEAARELVSARASVKIGNTGIGERRGQVNL